MALVVSLKNNIDIDIIRFKCIKSLPIKFVYTWSSENVSNEYFICLPRGEKFTQINTAMEGQMKTVWGSVPIFYLIIYINKSKNNVVPTYLNQIQKKKSLILEVRGSIT